MIIKDGVFSPSVRTNNSTSYNGSFQNLIAITGKIEVLNSTNVIASGNISVNNLVVSANATLGSSNADIINFNAKSNTDLDMNGKELLNVQSLNGFNNILNIPSITKITNTTNSTNTTTGALVVSGGVGIEHDVNIKGNLNMNSSNISNVSLMSGNDGKLSIPNGTYLHLSGYGGNISTTATGQGTYIGWNTNVGTGRTDFICNKGSGSGGFNFYIQDSMDSANVSDPLASISGAGLLTVPSANITDTTNSTNTTTGTLVVSGGVGIAQDVYIGGITTAQAYQTTSDYRIKTDVQVLNSTYAIDKLNPIKYTNLQNSRTEIGFLAHEVEQVYPFLVSGEKDGDALQSLNYIGLIGLLVNEIKLLKEKVNLLEKNLK